MPTANVSVTALANAAEPSTNGTFRISRDASSASSLNVFVQVTGTATPNQDFTAITSQQTIPANQSYVDVPVSVIDDSSFEASETVILTLQGGGGSYTVGSPSNATVNIADDETPVITVATASNAVEGGTGQFEFTRVSSNISQSLTVNFAIGGTATITTDYTGLSGSITFGANQNNASVTITALADNLVEGDETITATLSSGTGYVVGSPSTATLTITDDAPVVTVANQADAVEDGDDGAFRFTRSGGDQTQSLTVTYAVGGDATPDEDYTELSGSVTFAANSSTADVSVTAADDDEWEWDETVEVTVQAGSGNVVGVDATAAVAILENDGSIGGRAWLDSDSDGSQDTGEPGLGGVQVELHDSNSTLLDTTTTDADGNYMFLCPSADTEFKVHFAAPNHYTFTTANVGSDLTDSDADSYGYTSTISLDASENNNTTDVGITGNAPIVYQTQVYVEADDRIAYDMDLLANGYDPDDDPLSVTVVSSPSHGSLNFNTTTEFYDYTADSSYTGLDTFVYKLSDGTYDSDIVTVTILSHVGMIEPGTFVNFPILGDALYEGNDGKPDTFQIRQIPADCWLVAAAAGLTAQRPEFIPSLLTLNNDGSYCNVAISGTSVNIDTITDDGHNYSTANGDWLMLLEKGYAQIAWNNGTHLIANQPYDYLTVQRWVRSSIYAVASCGSWRRPCSSFGGIE